jgi:hypothetical protein
MKFFLFKTIRSKVEHAYRLFFIKFLAKNIPTIVLVEYPKSGGTWLGQLISSYLEIAFPRNTFPRKEKSLLHSHYLPSKELLKNATKIIWLVRDGRDVVISSYYHSLLWNDRNIINPKDVLYNRKKVPFSDYENISKNLAPFIDYLFNHVPSKITQFTYMGNWSNFNDKWNFEYHKNPKLIVKVRYEDLIHDTVRELYRIISEYFDPNPDIGKIKYVVDRFSFENQAKRAQGIEDKKSFLRKGKPGDWKNYFDEESLLRFDEYAASTMKELGYYSEKED